jgi:hypothetical protein
MTKIRSPAKLSFTWSGGNAGSEITLVIVEFIAHGQESELVITHEGFTNADLAQRYEMGWGTIARKFAEYLAGARAMGRSSKEQSMQDENRNQQVIRDFARIWKCSDLNYSPNNSLSRFVCARLTGISVCFLSSMRS